MKIETWDILSKLTLSPQATVEIQDENQLNIDLNNYRMNLGYGLGIPETFNVIRLFYKTGLEVMASSHYIWWSVNDGKFPAEIEKTDPLYFELLKDFILTLQELGFGDFNFVLKEWFPHEAKFV